MHISLALHFDIKNVPPPTKEPGGGGGVTTTYILSGMLKATQNPPRRNPEYYHGKLYKWICIALPVQQALLTLKY